MEYSVNISIRWSTVFKFPTDVMYTVFIFPPDGVQCADHLQTAMERQQVKSLRH